MKAKNTPKATPVTPEYEAEPWKQFTYESLRPVVEALRGLAPVAGASANDGIALQAWDAAGTIAAARETLIHRTAQNIPNTVYRLPVKAHELPPALLGVANVLAKADRLVRRLHNGKAVTRVELEAAADDVAALSAVEKNSTVFSSATGDDFQRADYFTRQGGLTADALDQARRAERLTGEKRGGRWFYSQSDVYRLWPDAKPN